MAVGGDRGGGVPSEDWDGDVEGRSTISRAERSVCEPLAVPSSTSTKTPPGATKLHITAVAAALNDDKKQAAQEYEPRHRRHHKLGLTT